MELSEILSGDDVFSGMKAGSKKQLLQDIADKASLKTGMPSRQIFETLLQRERLGSTGVGSGIAIPHGKLPGIKSITGIFVKLGKPVDFEALDDQPVDLVFLLLAPEGAGADHLTALARIARVMRDAETLDKIREADNAEAIYTLLTSETTSSRAA